MRTLLCCLFCGCALTRASADSGGQANSLRAWTESDPERVDGQLDMLQMRSAMQSIKMHDASQKAEEVSQGLGEHLSAQTIEQQANNWLGLGEIHEHMTESELGVLRTKLNAGMYQKTECGMDLNGVGSEATICEQGYLQVASLCCNYQMEFFIVRVVTQMGFKVCHEGGVMGLVPWFNCGNFQSLSLLKEQIKRGTTTETPCPVFEKIGDNCTEWSIKCWNETTVGDSNFQNEAYHRRRVCNTGKDAGAGKDWTHVVPPPPPPPVPVPAPPSPGPSGGGTTTIIGGSGGTTTIIGGYGGSGDTVITIYTRPPTPAFKPYPAPAPVPCSCGAVATFQHMGGTNIMQATIKGRTEEELDDVCAKECLRHEDCQFWVRQFNQDGRYLKKPAICWLRKNAGGESYNLGYRGGWRTPGGCFEPTKGSCVSSFQEFSGSNVPGGKIGICGKDDDALDAACHKACVENPVCSHWFRDNHGGSTSGVTACQLRYNPGSEYKYRPQSRGGWKQGCGNFPRCDAQFQEKGGRQVARMGVYGDNHGQLDAACCYLCAMNKDCEYWVREWGNYGNRVCYLRAYGGGFSWSWTKRGGWNKICGVPNAPRAFATFQELGGILVATERVCGMNNTELDTQCSVRCLENSLCQYWVREKGKEGFVYCWLRKFNTNPRKSASANRRGGYRTQTACGAAYVKNDCRATFDHLSGTQVALEFVCGNSDEELDAHCCELCRQTTDCQFWVRETRKTTDTDERPKLCYLRKNAGGYSKHTSYTGGFRQGCGGKVSTCTSTFQERGGPQVEVVGVCGSSDPYYLDSACCQKCAENPKCEFWVRDINYPTLAHGAFNTSRCYLRYRGALNPSNNANKRGGWNKICGAPNAEACVSQFQDQGGLQVAQERICGRSDAELDAQCCHKCKQSDFCEYWVREKGSKGYMYCWLRRRDSANRKPNTNVNRRGGYREGAKCGDKFLSNGCRSIFREMSGSQVGLEYVCGKTDDELDAHCCEKCRNNTLCEFWVREVRPATETDITRPKICWLRKNAGSGSNNPLRAGGWRQGCGTKPGACKAGFQERGGSQVTKVGVCGANPYSNLKQDKEHLDAVCCDLCAQHPQCEFWVREVNLPTVAQGGANTSFCYLRKNGAVSSSASTTKRGGWNRICGHPGAPRCRSVFQDLAGSLVDTIRVCGQNDTALDSECCYKCRQHQFCNHWVREKGSNGWKTCWLRTKHPNPNVKPNSNVNRRGGYKEEPKCGDHYLKNGCRGTFEEMTGAQVSLEYVCGGTDDELDAMCCALCRNNTDCEFWVRERRSTWEEDASRPKICWLRKNAGSARKSPYRRGGWKHGCGMNVPKCYATFQDRSGPQTQKLAVCGTFDRKELDSQCCELCARNPTCEFWVRETDIPAKNHTFCYLRYRGSVNPTARTNKRGAWNRICGNPKLPVARSVFQNMGGGLVDTTRVCSNTSRGLDTECAAKCREHEFCEFWLRETHPSYPDTGYKYCWLYRKATSRSASTVRRGGWREQKACGAAYMGNKCSSAFHELSGSQAALTFVCGDSDEELDAMCCSECKNNTRCEFWVREAGTQGSKQCWLRYNPGGFSKNLNRRGGWKNGCAKQQKLKSIEATFQDYHGPEVDKLGVCGDNDKELDSACGNLCDNHKDCEFWVRESGATQTNQKNSKFCWLRKIGSSARSNSNRRGGRKECKSGSLKACKSTFDNMGGSHIETNRTCGNTDAELDAGCCAKCDANPNCAMWLREAGTAGGNMGYKYCWLYRNPSAYPSRHSQRRGGLKKLGNTACSASFKDMDGSQIQQIKVWGNTDDEIDSNCCAMCRANSMCQFWVREVHVPGNAIYVPGGKWCWLRRMTNGIKRNRNNRRGGMKASMLMQNDANVKPGVLEEGEPVNEPEEPLPPLASNDVQDEEAAEADEAEKKLLGATQMAETTGDANGEGAVQQTKEQQAQEKKLEAEALKKFYEAKLNLAGSTAVLDENGYMTVAKLKSNDEMEKFILRVIAKLHLELTDEGGLAGIVPFYSGVQDIQSYEHLQLELEEAANDPHKEKWLTARDVNF